MRDMPRLLAAAGLELIETQSHVVSDIGRGVFFAGFVETYGQLVARNGLLPQADVDRWIGDQRLALSEGRFFAACNYYAYVTRKPG
jgi:hypothetical protein